LHNTSSFKSMSEQSMNGGIITQQVVPNMLNGSPISQTPTDPSKVTDGKNGHIMENKLQTSGKTPESSVSLGSEKVKEMNGMNVKEDNGMKVENVKVENVVKEDNGMNVVKENIMSVKVENEVKEMNGMNVMKENNVMTVEFGVKVDGMNVVKEDNGMKGEIIDKSAPNFLLPPLTMPYKERNVGDVRFMNEKEKEGPGVQLFNTSYYSSEYQYYFNNTTGPQGQMKVEYSENGRKEFNNIMHPPYSQRRNQYLPFPIDDCMQPQTGIPTSFPDKDLKKPEINNDIEEIDKKNNNKPINNVIKKRKRTLKNNWNKMTEALFKQMLEYEKQHPDIKQCELQKVFNINRSTYWRWKKKFNNVCS